jgi:tetratricopeptide (TPR) repeat protein
MNQERIRPIEDGVKKRREYLWKQGTATIMAGRGASFVALHPSRWFDLWPQSHDYQRVRRFGCDGRNKGHGMSGWRRWFTRMFTGKNKLASRIVEAADKAYGEQEYRVALPLYEDGLLLFRELEQWYQVLVLRLRLGYLTQILGNYSAARAHFEQAVSLARNQKLATPLGAALIGLASAGSRQGEVALAHRLCDECAQMWSKPQYGLQLASVYNIRGSIAETMAEARVHHLRALEIYQERNYQEGIIASLCCLGHCTEAGQDNANQRAWLQECLELCESPEHEKTRSYVLNNLGNIERFEGNFDRATELYRESLHLKEQIGDEWGIAYTFEGCAAIAAARQQGVSAARLLGIAGAIRHRLGTPLEPSKQPEYDATLIQVRKLLTASELEAAWDEGGILSTTEAIGQAVMA